jgi:hypothetical protein
MARVQGIVLAAVVAFVAPALALGRSRPLPGTPVPRGFVGVNIDGPVLTPEGGVAMPDQFGLMRSSGAQSIRVIFGWSAAQPYASWANVPAGQQGGFVSGAGGIPTSFAATDQIVSLAAARGMSVLPIVMNTPSWDALPRSGAGLPRPRDDGLYGKYLTTLIGRYGPRGSFWRQYPGLPRRPIRNWEIWNEPDIVGFWPTQPFARSYVALLSAAHSAIRRADPGGRVVLAGVPNFSWQVLKSIYRVRGARRLFEVVDVHPYTKRPAGVIEILRRVRVSMMRGGDSGKPIIAAETGWPSSLQQTPHRFDFETTPAGQARNLRALLPLLAANRKALGLIGFYWYTWMGAESPGAYPFSFSGLLAFHNGQVSAKPALAAFAQTARAIER